MSFLTKIIDFFRPAPSIIKFSAVPNYEPEEVKPEEVKPKKAKATQKPVKHTKTSLMELTKKQLVALGNDEFNIQLDQRKTKAILVKKLLSTFKKER